MKNIKNIIFDLGGVFIDIHYLYTKNAFEKLGIQDFDIHFRQTHSNPLFSNFEKGLISDETFFDEFRKETNMAFSDKEIAQAWNAMLGNFRKKSVEWLEKIGGRYNVFLFSNTNHVHYMYFSELFQHTFGKKIESLFTKAYYSHELHQRKPDAAGFLAILSEQRMFAEETLFIDDTEINTNAAEMLNMKTILLKSSVSVENLEL